MFAIFVFYARSIPGYKLSIPYGIVHFLVQVLLTRTFMLMLVVSCVINTNDFFIATERKKQSAEIIVLAKQKNNHNHYVALANKVK